MGAQVAQRLSRTLVAQRFAARAQRGKRRNCLFCLHDATQGMPTIPVGLFTNTQGKRIMNNSNHFGGVVFGKFRVNPTTSGVFMGSITAKLFQVPFDTRLENSSMS